MTDMFPSDDASEAGQPVDPPDTFEGTPAVNPTPVAPTAAPLQPQFPGAFDPGVAPDPVEPAADAAVVEGPVEQVVVQEAPLLVTRRFRNDTTGTINWVTQGHSIAPGQDVEILLPPDPVGPLPAGLTETTWTARTPIPAAETPAQGPSAVLASQPGLTPAPLPPLAPETAPAATATPADVGPATTAADVSAPVTSGEATVSPAVTPGGSPSASPPEAPFVP